MVVKKLTTLNHEQKRAICRHKQQNPNITGRELVSWTEEKWGAKVHDSTICRILSQSLSLLSNVTANQVKRKKEALCPTVEEALYRWFLSAQEAKIPLADDLLIEKAKVLYEEVLKHNPDEKPCAFSNGWLGGFKKRHGIALRTLHGEANSIVLTDKILEALNVLKRELAQFEECDIFNMDETGLFFKMPPNKILRDQAMAGEKKDKTRLTVGLCCNSDGSIKLPPIIINKYKNPRAFSRRRIKRPNNLGILWYSNKRAWMTGRVFQDWLLQFDRYLKGMGRSKAALVVDNAPGHLFRPVAHQLEVVKVFFLPANTTARFQPLDAGIIQCFKVHYRKALIRRQLQDFEESKPFDLDVYEAIQFILSSWTDKVTQRTIRNCWRHCDLLPHQDDRPDRNPRLDIDLERPFFDLDLNAEVLELIDYMTQASNRYPVDLNVSEYLAVDDVHGAPTFSTDPNILDFLVDSVDAEENENEDLGDAEPTSDPTQEIEGSEQVPQMTYGVGMALFESLFKFLEQQDYDTIGMAKSLKKIQKSCSSEHSERLVQSQIDSFFVGELPVVHGSMQAEATRSSDIRG